MQLKNSFTVPVPVDEAWRVLLDIERIAPCMPGAVIDGVEGDSFTGRVKVKLGPVSLTYRGRASFVEKDEVGHRAVIDARGKDQRGNGTAAATIVATLVPEESTTRVDVSTDLNVTGRPAQFGRGVITDVSNRLLGQFADSLAAHLSEAQSPADAGAVPTDATAGARTGQTAAGQGAKRGATKRTAGPATVPASPSTDPTVPGRPAPVAEPEAINLLGVAGGAAVARYIVPAAGAATAVLVLAFALRRRRQRSRRYVR